MVILALPIGIGILIVRGLLGLTGTVWWHPWLLAVAVVLAGIGAVSALFKSVKYLYIEAGGPALDALVGVLGLGGLIVTAVLDLAGWEAPIRVVATALLGASLVPLPLGVGRSSFDKPLPLNKRVAAALGGVAIAATCVVAVASFDLSTGLMLVVLSPTVVSTGLVCPVVVHSIVVMLDRPVRARLATMDLEDLSMAVAVFAGGAYLAVVTALSTFPIWLSIVFWVIAVFCLIGAAGWIGEELSKPPTIDDTPDQPVRPDPRPSASTPAVGDRALAMALDRLAARPDGVFRLLPVPERRVRN